MLNIRTLCLVRNFISVTFMVYMFHTYSLIFGTGDVDSADDNDSESSHTASQPRPIRLAQPFYRRKHETKLWQLRPPVPIVLACIPYSYFVKYLLYLVFCTGINIYSFLFYTNRLVFIQDVIIYLNLLNSEVRLTKWPMAQLVFYSVVLCDGCSRSQPPPLIQNINGFKMLWHIITIRNTRYCTDWLILQKRGGW